MAEPLKIGIAGLGNVGAHTFKLVQRHGDLLARRCGRPLAVTAVSARDRDKDRGVDLGDVNWLDNPLDLAGHNEADVIVELIGGDEGVAYDLVKASLESGRHVVTANKALLAKHGGELFTLAEERNVALKYEAAVAGGIPIIKGIREGLAGNAVEGVYGILNGTCNFILSEMADTGRAFEDVLKEAQERGFAEADPTFDVDGIDAAHKISLLAALAYGGLPQLPGDIRGIRNITPMDIRYAEKLGYRIKLLGIARNTDNGIELSVEPCLVPEDEPISAVDGSLNAVYVDGDFVGNTLFVGHGAGGDPTASAVVADIIDIARGNLGFAMGVPAMGLKPLPTADTNMREGSWYLRLMVLDKPGVIADIAAILRDYDLSLESVLQHSRAPDKTVPVVLTSHESNEGDMRAALAKIAALDAVVEEPHMMRIETFGK